jgi:hypothetical protein
MAARELMLSAIRLALTGCGYSSLADPDIPAIARKLALREPPLKVEPAAEYDA